MTSVGRFTSATTFAIVKVLPEPVTPSSTWCGSPRRSPAVSSAMARGWSPVGCELALEVEGHAHVLTRLPVRFSGDDDPGRRPRRRTAIPPRRRARGILRVMLRPLALTVVLAALAVVTAGCPDDDETKCPTGQTACGGVCFDLQTDRLSCGTCVNVCAEGATCVAGQCRCPEGQSACDGACVDVLSNASHCGTCGQSCGLGTCSAGGCVCQPGATDECGGNPACLDFLTDASNCGGCGLGCRTRGFCDGGTCACPAPYPAECPTYCANLASTSDCGVCGNACAVGGLCDTTQTPPCRCPGTEVPCGAVAGGTPGTCTDTATDDANCGSCGKRCPTLATCTASDCKCPVEAPTTCGSSPGTCTNLRTDDGHCGNCTTACATGATCVAGACCPATRPACADVCCTGGDACCGTACQPAHDNGLGGTYFLGCSLFAPNETTQEAAVRAADAWNAGTTVVDTTACGTYCLGRQTATSCAIWCYGISGVAGRVELNTINNACVTCPTFGSPSWN